MTYAGDRVIHDADSHLMELGDCLDPYFDPAWRDAYHALPYYRHKVGDGAWSAEARKRQADPAFRAGDADNLLLRKGYDGLGAFLPADRPKAIDLFGFASQLVFTTFCLGNFGLETGGDPALAYAAADAHNRMMTDFCSVDRRLLPTGYAPLVAPERTLSCVRTAIELGARGIMIPSKCPSDRSPSHVDFEPVWSEIEAAGLPVLLHVGGELKMDPAYAETGRPKVKDFHGGEENFTSVSFMAIPVSPMQTLATLILDGVLDRHPRLKFGVVELGASWVPSWMRYMDAGYGAFFRHEDRLKALSMKPSDFVRRQVRVTPYPHEDVAWIIEQAGEEIALFSSDFPHVEGGRNPLKRFDDALAGLTESARRRFYERNFVDLMGAGLDPALGGAPVRQAAE